MAASESNEPNDTNPPRRAPRAGDPPSAPGSVGGPGSATDGGPPGDARDVPPGRAAGVSRDVRALVHQGLDAMANAGTLSAASVADALEGGGRTLARRVVTAAAATADAELADRRSLEKALAERPRVVALESATTAAMAVKVASRFKRLGFLARRTPAYLLVAAVPAVAASVTRGADELGMVAAHLVHRARAEGVEPDLERVRRAAVQVVSGRVIDPETEPSHGPLVVRWMRRAARAALPFTSGVATADPRGLAATAAAIDVTTLGPA